MKIYAQDHSWAGCILVAANSEEEAREKMEKFRNYEAAQALEEFEIDANFEYENTGDS